MKSNPRPYDMDGMAVRFMWFIAFWNHAEMVAKQIAQNLLGESSMSMALTAEVGNRTLMEAIEVASHEAGEIGPHLRHFSKGYSTLLGYRNFYVHSFYGTTQQSAGCEALLYAIDGKGRARYFSQTLSQPDLDSITKAIHALIGYGAAIQKELGVEGDGIEGLLTTYSGSLEKPHWPPQVEKTPLYLKGQEPPPQEPNRKRGTKKGKKGS